MIGRNGVLDAALTS